MKVEKVNEQQIRCTLTREDLSTRNIKVSELAYGSEKTQDLFRDMMHLASYECGFEADDIPLMIEAVPLDSERILLIVTKVEDPEELDTRFSKFAPSVHDEESEDEESDELLDALADGADDVLNMLRRMNEEREAADADRDEAATLESVDSKTAQNHPADDIVPIGHAVDQLYSFPSMHEVTRLAHIVAPYFRGDNSLYKDGVSGRYLLLLSPEGLSATVFNKTCNLVSEYGSAEKSVHATRAHLEEHFEPLIKSNALDILSRL
jgi:adapter protein MecA 1/2